MMTTSLYADYEHSWNKHNFKVTAGMNTEYYYINALTGKRYDVINENVPSINTATGTSDLKGSSKEWATMGATLKGKKLFPCEPLGSEVYGYSPAMYF